MKLPDIPAKIFPDDHVRHLRRDCSLLRDNEIDVLRGSYIECRVAHSYMGKVFCNFICKHLTRGPLLDLDQLPHNSPRRKFVGLCCNDNINPRFCSGVSDLGSTDLVHYGTINRDRIGTYYHEVYIMNKRSHGRIDNEIRLYTGIVQGPDRDKPLVSRANFSCKDLDLLAAPVCLNDASKCHFRITVRQDRIAIPYVTGTETRDLFYSML